MSAHCPNKKNEGIASIVVVVVLVAALAGGFYLFKNGIVTLPTLGPTPTEEPRVNPEPTSGYTISVGEVNPGTQVVIDSLDLADLATVVIIKDGATQTTIGKTELLKAGQHTSVTIKLTTAIKDGDVIFIRLLDKNAKPIQNETKVNIEVMKNVGMLMSHYENEY